MISKKLLKRKTEIIPITAVHQKGAKKIEKRRSMSALIRHFIRPLYRDFRKNQNC
jgi:hypothetical protein